MTTVKTNIEAYFKSAWTASPIQWEGVDYSPTGDKWIALAFIPIDRTQYAFDGGSGRFEDTILLKVTSFGSSGTLALELDDEVRRFIECYEDMNFKVGAGVPSGDGIIPLDNGVFMVSSNYEIKNYN